MIMAFMPYAEVLMSAAKLVVFRIYDSGTLYMFKNGENLKSKCVTKQQYIDLFTGPEYLIHFKYSSILV